MTAVLLVYENLDAARSFFLDTLGFDEEWLVRSDDGCLVRSHVRLGDTVLLLDSPGAHGVRSPRAVRGVTHLVVITVGDVDAHHARAVAAGAKVVVPWGRDYEVEDGEGYIFSFIS